MLKVNPWWLLAAFAAMFIYWFLEAVVLQTASKPANKDQRFFFVIPDYNDWPIF